ncbi:hypothetical protein ACOSQ4_031524 [Xanthoceras sorbifolium]
MEIVVKKLSKLQSKKLALTLTRGKYKWSEGTSFIPHSKCIPFYCFLNKFICSNIYPASNISKVNFATGKLLYIIGTSKLFNVGTYIFELIDKCANESKSKLKFSDLITKICLKASVRLRQTDKIVENSQMFDKDLFNFSYLSKEEKNRKTPQCTETIQVENEISP